MLNKLFYGSMAIIILAFISSLTIGQGDTISTTDVDTFTYPVHKTTKGGITIYDQADSSKQCYAVGQDKIRCLIWVIIDNNDFDFPIDTLKSGFKKDFEYKNPSLVMSEVSYIDEVVELEGFVQCQYLQQTTEQWRDCSKMLTTRKTEVFKWKPYTTMTSTKGSKKAIGVWFDSDFSTRGQYSWDIDTGIDKLSVGTTFGGCVIFNTSGYYEMKNSSTSTATCNTLLANNTHINCNSTGWADKVITFSTTTTGSAFSPAGSSNLVNITIDNCYITTPFPASTYGFNCIQNCPYNLTFKNIKINGSQSAQFFIREVGGSVSQTPRPTNIINVTVFGNMNVMTSTTSGYTINTSNLSGSVSMVGHPNIENTDFNLRGQTFSLSDSSNQDSTNVIGKIYKNRFINLTAATTAGQINVQSIKTGSLIWNSNSYSTTTPAITTTGVGLSFYDLLDGFQYTNNSHYYYLREDINNYAFTLLNFKSLLNVNASNNYFFVNAINKTSSNFLFEIFATNYVSDSDFNDNYIEFANRTSTNSFGCEIVTDNAGANNRYNNLRIDDYYSEYCLPIYLYKPTLLTFTNLQINKQSNISINATLSSTVSILDSPSINNENFVVIGTGKILYSWTHNAHVYQVYYGGNLSGIPVSYFNTAEGNYYGGGVTGSTGYTANYYLPEYKVSSLGKLNMSFVATASTYSGVVQNTSYSINNTGTWEAGLLYTIGFTNKYASSCSREINAGEGTLSCSVYGSDPQDNPTIGANGKWIIRKNTTEITRGNMIEDGAGAYHMTEFINTTYAGAYNVLLNMSFTDTDMIESFTVVNSTRICTMGKLIVSNRY